MRREDERERVLVIGDDMRIFLAVVRSLGRAGKEVHAAPFNWHAPALKSRYIAASHRLPRYPDDPAAWLSALLDLLRRYGFALVVPCCDRAILPLDAHREALAGYRIAIPNAETIAELFDKERTRRLCDELGIPVAPGARLEPGDTAQAIAARFGLPVVIKPRGSYTLDRLEAPGKVWIVDSEAELEAMLAAIGEPSLHLAEAYFDGVGVGVSVLAEDGLIQHAFQHRRLRQGRGGSSSYRISEPVAPALLDAAARISARLKLTGVCMFEFRYDPTGHGWVLLEANARFWGSLPLPLSLGVDFPRFLCDLLVEGRRHPPVLYPPGVRSRNLVLDGYNLLTGLNELRPGAVARWCADIGDFLTQPIRWASGREHSDSFVSDDPRPGLWECGLLWKSLAQKASRRLGAGSRRRPAKEVALGH